MNNENFKKYNELVNADQALADERQNALLDEELDQVNAATGTGTGEIVCREWKTGITKPGVEVPVGITEYSRG